MQRIILKFTEAPGTDGKGPGKLKSMSGKYLKLKPVTCPIGLASIQV